MMNARERWLAAVRHGNPDYVPLYCQCFGFTAPPHLRWRQNGREVQHWYSMRQEHLHTWPEPWSLDDDFERVRRWASLGVDDVLEVSPPWGVHPDVRIRDWQEPPDANDRYARVCREYTTPAGMLLHVVHRTDEKIPPGWVVQSDRVALFEDMNIPRGVRHAVVGPDDLPKLRYLLQPPSVRQLADYRERVARLRRFADEQGVLVLGWSAFGMDALTWLCGVERTVMAAMTEPEFFQELVDIVFEFDRQRTEMMLDVGGVDVVLQRGWYGSTDFWSPSLFQRFLTPGIQPLAALAHQAGAIFAYVLTTGAMAMVDQLLSANVDLLLYVDPTQERTGLAALKAKVKGRLALAGGISSAITLYRGTREEIRQAVHTAVQELGPSGFILAPVSSLSPDIPWPNVEAMIEAWREVRDFH